MTDKIFGSTGPTVTMAVTTANTQATLTGYVGVVRAFNAGPNIAFLRFATAALWRADR